MGISWLDVQLGVRMLIRYKGLTLAGGLALAIAIGLGAGWYDVMRDQLHPTLPLPDGDRFVEVEVRNAASNAAEQRVLHDFLNWRTEVRTIEDLGAYRTIERNLILGDARPEPLPVAEITASAFRVARVPPLLGRPLLDADEQPGAPPVVVLGYRVWQQQFGGRPDVIGRTLQLGRAQLTVVGVMPEGFAFPENHKFWIPLQLPSSGYAPLEGPAVFLFGRLAPGMQPPQATAEIAALISRVAATSPATHQHLRPRVFPYGAQDLGGGSWIDFAITHGPVLLVLIVACANVGTLVYARTATREAEIAVRHALGASRARIVGQLFVEALVLAAVAAVVGLFVADLVLRLVFAYIGGGLAFLDPSRPEIRNGDLCRAAGGRCRGDSRSAPSNQSHWIGRAATPDQWRRRCHTAVREGVDDGDDRAGRADGDLYCSGDGDVQGDSARSRHPEPVPGRTVSRRGDHGRSRQRGTPPRRSGRQRGVRVRGACRAVIWRARTTHRTGTGRPGDHVRRPAAGHGTARCAASRWRPSPGADPISVPELWTAAVGPGYFEMFDRPILSGRDFHGGDRSPGARSVVVNEAFARRYTKGEQSRRPARAVSRVRPGTTSAVARHRWDGPRHRHGADQCG